MEPPSCAAKAELSILSCNTCCCKAGLVSTKVTMQMIVGSQNKCGAWLSVGDWMMRMFVGMMRMYLSIDLFAPRCFSGSSSDNPNGAGSKAQQQYCSTKPGGTGKHLLASRFFFAASLSAARGHVTPSTEHHLVKKAAEALGTLDSDPAANSAEMAVLGRKLLLDGVRPARLVKTMARLEELIERAKRAGDDTCLLAQLEGIIWNF